MTAFSITVRRSCSAGIARNKEPATSLNGLPHGVERFDIGEASSQCGGICQDLKTVHPHTKCDDPPLDDEGRAQLGDLGRLHHRADVGEAHQPDMLGEGLMFAVGRAGDASNCHLCFLGRLFVSDEQTG